MLGYSHALIRLLHIPPHTIWSFPIHLCTGFFISGFFHALSLSALASYPPMGYIFKCNLLFFMAQVLAIIFEEIMIKKLRPLLVAMNNRLCWESHSQGILLSLLGHLWVFSWLVLSASRWWDIYFRIGMANWQMPFPILGVILRRI